MCPKFFQQNYYKLYQHYEIVNDRSNVNVEKTANTCTIENSKISNR